MDQKPDEEGLPPPDELAPATWRRLYVATIVWGILTIAALWWFTATFGN